MKRKTLLILLCMLLAILSAGCGAQGDGDGQAAESASEGRPELLEGYYEAQDENGETAGYLHVTRSRFITYDASGNEQDSYELSFDENRGLYLLDDKKAFTLQQGRRYTYLVTWADEDEYALIEIERSDLPDGTAIAVSGGTELSAEEVYELAMPSTVDITAWSSAFSYTGTGFFDDSDGTVITNYHVIDGTYGGYITTSDGQEYDILSVLGYDADLDIAILSTACAKSVPLSKRSGEIHTGEKVYALGSSRGLSGTFTDGQVSSAVREYYGQTYIQHTAPISHGNSGGPLLDKNGEVIGINSAYIDDAQNLNLAIPIGKVGEVSRDTNLSMESLYAKEYGGSAYGTAAPDDWVTDIVAMDGSVGLWMSLPQELYDQLEVNDTYTGTTLYYETDSYVIDIETDADDDAYPPLDEIGDDLTDDLLDSLREVFVEIGIGDYYVDSYMAELNDTEWLIFEGYGYEDDVGLAVYLFVTVEDGCLITSAFMYAGYDDAGFTEADDLFYAICSTMEIY